MDGLRNPKYAMVERFQRGVFTGTNEKMRYVKPLCASPLTRNRRKDRRRKQSLLDIGFSTKPYHTCGMA
jgi:hypothetical protein